MSEFDEDEPKIYLEKEDKEAYLRQRNKQKQPKAASSSTETSGSTASGRNHPLNILTFLLVLAAGGASGWLYYQNKLQHDQLSNAQQRIEELERKLSDTGAEMGESTIALQTKVKQLAEKSDELWEQMDKLWASAWRRNQADIQGLSKKLDNATAPISELSQKTKVLESDLGLNNTSIVALQEQFSSLQSSHSMVQRDLEQLLSTQDRTSKQVSDVNSKLTNAVMNNQNLASRMNKLEAQIKSLSKPVVSSPTQ